MHVARAQWGRHEFLLGAIAQGVWETEGRKSPGGIQGRNPGRSSVGKVPAEAETVCRLG